MSDEIKCVECQRPRTMADDIDYSPLQAITGRPLGWYSADDSGMCGECLSKIISNQLRSTR